MFLHIGSNIEIPLKNIISIIDIETSKDKINKEFLSNIDNRVNVTSKKPKTIILVENKKNKYTLFISPISSYTLKKRVS